MKKLIYLIVSALILSLVLTGCLLTNVGQVPATEQTKVKPEGLGAQTYAWYLSADVMPVPPYGSRDIPGSDSASKLIVNQPNGAVEVTITGVMNGLTPNTVYTVYLSKGYTPYVYTGWSIMGDWTFRGVYSGSNYDHDYTITQQTGNIFSGTGGYPAGGPPYSITETINGTIDAMTGEITLFYIDYDNSNYWSVATGIINPDGTITGTWGNDSQGYGHPWYSISGNAVKTHTGSTGWPGLFTGTVQPFTFTTDDSGSGSWHVNLRNSDFSETGTFTLSVWINVGLTILISDNFEVVVD